MKWVIIGFVSGLSHAQHQVIILTTAHLLWIGTKGTNFIEIFIVTIKVSFQENQFQIVIGKSWIFVHILMC